MVYKQFLLLLLLAGIVILSGCSQEKSKENKSASNEKSTSVVKLTDQEVEASCGQCQFGVSEPKGCDLAIRVDGKVYFVDGTSIDDHGDAHGKDGFCNCVRHAKVSGEIKDGRFKVNSFKLLEKKPAK